MHRRRAGEAQTGGTSVLFANWIEGFVGLPGEVALALLTSDGSELVPDLKVHCPVVDPTRPATDTILDGNGVRSFRYPAHPFEGMRVVRGVIRNQRLQAP
jgi:hypothetical protein